jgi:hypothetical protein
LRNFLAKTELSRLHRAPEYDMITCKDMLFIVESSVKGIFFNPGSRKPLLKKKLMAVRKKAPLCKGSLENAQKSRDRKPLRLLRAAPRQNIEPKRYTPPALRATSPTGEAFACR